MKVLGIVGSPRSGGNAETLLEEALASAKEAGSEVEMIRLREKDLSFCDGCDTCRDTRRCHIADDMQEVHAKMLEADGIILSAPVYFWALSAQTKLLIDRSYAFEAGHQLRGKVGAGIVVARRAGAGNALLEFMEFFNTHRMIYAGGALAYGDKRGDVRGDAWGLGEAKALGRVVVRYIQNTNLRQPRAGQR
ncbi:MAG: flavodoxin family protein [Chloroflexi bacterium]|nr:flavodoxin family protein [Chloroflexota bacterium]